MSSPKLHRLMPACLVRVATATLLLVVSPLTAATYYVATNGSDANDGTSAATPWKTIAKANATLAAGDTVLIRGGEYTGANAQIKPASSGTGSSRIVYRAYPGTGDPSSWEKPTIADTGGGLDAIHLAGKNYITIDGLTVTGRNIYPDSTVAHWGLIDGGAHHNVIQNCTFKFALGVYGLKIDFGTQYNQILNSSFDHAGAYSRVKDGVVNDYGEVIDLDGEYNLLAGCTLKHGGHNLLQVTGKYNVIRDNVFDNDYSALEGAGKGARCVAINGAVSANGQVKSQFNVFERNVVKNAGYAVDGDHHPPGMKVEGLSHIIRHNYFFDNIHDAITSNVRELIPYTKYNHIYHNVFYNNGGPAWTARPKGGNGTEQIDFNVVKNNIAYKNRQDPMSADFDVEFHLNVPGAVTIGNNKFIGNLMAKAAANDAQIRVVDIGTNSLAYFQTNHAAAFSGNAAAVPTFVSATPSSPEDFKPAAGGAQIDAGDFLTRTVGSGSSATTIAVADARYFHNSFGVPTVSGDSIKVGSNAPVLVTAVDYDANTITVASAISWSNNDGVSLDYAGSGPDAGPWEYTAATTPSAPSNLTATAVSGTQINLSWVDNAANETGFSVERKTSLAGSYAEVATPGTNATTHNDTGLTSGTTYYYRVASENANGLSTWSNEATATTTGGSAPSVFDANSLSVASSSGDGSVAVTNSGAVGGSFLRYNANATGDFVALSVSVPAAATYEVTVRFHKNGWRGIAQLAIDGVNHGSAQDLYDAGSVFADVNLGAISLASGTREFRFTTTGKNAAAADYQIGIDSITLTPTGAADTTSPTVSVTAPTNGATVSGTTTISATASDNVAVVGVQFKLDGANLQAEDTSSPYSLSWDTTSVTPGAHTIAAVARDAAGNTQTSSISVTVADQAAPTVEITAPLATAAVSGNVTLAAMAEDNVAVVGVQFKVDGVNLGSEDTTAPFGLEWDTTTATNGAHTLTAVARDAAGNTTTSAGVAVTVNNGAPSVFDANGLTVAASSGDGTTSVTEAGGSGGNFLRYNSNATNDYVTFSVSVPATQTYQVSVRFHRNAWRGIVQLAIDGTNHGTAQDAYNATAGYWSVDLGTTSLTAGTRAFKFTVTGKNASASDYQIGIDTITLTPLLGTPAAPSGLAATVLAADEVELSWTDNSTNETGFEIQRKENGGSFATIHTTEVGETSWNDGTALPGNYYTYQVRAKGVSADSSWASAVSAGTPLVLDANMLTVSASSGDGTTVVANTAAAGADFLRYNSNATNDQITLSVEVTNGLTYAVAVSFHRNGWRGIAQLAIDGTNHGSAQDTYAATAGFVSAALGNVALTAGTRAFKFTITGKNGSSSDYQLGLDTITLTPTGL